MFDPKTVREWIVAAEEEVSDLARQVERAQFQLAEARRRLMLLYEMLASVTNGPVGVSPDKARTTRPVREQVQSDAEAILRERGMPMRAQDLHAEFIRRGMPLPGRGTPTNIIAHIVASDRFSRRGRGVYGLTEWAKEQPSTHHRDSGGPRRQGQLETANKRSGSGRSPVQ